MIEKPKPLIIVATASFLSTSAMAACPLGSVTSSTFNLSSGDTCASLDAGTAGIINAPGVTINGTAGSSGGISVNAHDSGQINFSGSSTVDVIAASSGQAALRASVGGSVIDARNGTAITVRGTGSSGSGDAIVMLNGGQVLLDTSTVINVKTVGYGVVVDNTITNLAGAGITINGFSSTSFGNGLQVRNGGNVVVSDSLAITGSGAIKGIFVQSNGTLDVSPNATVGINLSNTKGVNVYGVHALSGGTVNGGNFDISVPSGNGYGFRSENPGSFIDATNSRVELGAASRAAYAVAMVGGGLVKVDDTTTIHSIGTAIPGLDNVGIRIDGTSVPNGTVGPGLTITMDGTSGMGIWARALTSIPASSSISVDRLTVTGSGVRLGLIAESGSSISATNSTVTAHANGLSSTAALLVFGNPVSAADPTLVGGTINFTNSTAQLLGAAGATAGGIRALSSDTPSVVNLNSSSVTTESAPGITAVGGRVNINLTNGSSVIGGGGLLVQAISDSTALAAAGDLIVSSAVSTRIANGDTTDDTFGFNTSFGNPSIVNLTATGGSKMTGDAFADAASILNITLSGNSLWTGAGLNVTNVTLGNPSTWAMTGNSTVSQTTTNAGLIRYATPTGDPTQLSNYLALATRDYVGQGGTLAMNTFLGTNSSPSDRLIISGGTASGNSFLRIANAGGAGALTTGNGILAVDAINGATTAVGAFALSGPVVAGPYEYTLFRSSVDTSNAQAWYLRSTLNCALSPNLPECQSPPTPSTPNFRVEASLYAAIPSMALLYGRNLLDTLHERVGEEFDEGLARNALASGYYKAAPAAPGSQSLGWGRIIGMNGVQQGASEGVLSPGTGGPHFDYAFLGLQAGMDFLRWDRPDGSRDHAGSYFAIGGSRGTVTHFDGKEGNSDFSAYTLGGYWTHFGPTGWYLDAILQGTYYDISSTANRGLPTFKTAAQGFAGSLEGGYPFKFAGGWFIEPQAQLIYQNINVNDASDIAAQIRFADVDSLLGRIGARFGRTWALDDGLRTITAWIRPNLWNEFRGNPTTSFSSETGFIPFHADLGGFWGELNVGVSGQVRTNTTLYANASYQSRFDGGGFAYAGKAGLRVN